MADQFVGPMQSDLEGMGYSVVIQGSPCDRQWHTVPLVSIAPEVPLIEWDSFNEIDQTNIYTVFYVDKFNGSTALNPAVDEFTSNMRTFHGLPTSLESAGAWNVFVSPAYSVDRSVFGDDFLASMVRVSVHWIAS